ncbi:MAG: biopolymer transporter ExbD [Candidatus Cloacimonetes bacterium]|nr:biopolymer transporter ExbD [Candidatus Cloacimonadota bacterium]
MINRKPLHFRPVLMTLSRRKSIRIISLLDAFTILLVFLLKNFAADNSLGIALQQNIVIPKATTTQSLESLPYVTVNSTTIAVNENTITDKGIDGIFTTEHYRHMGERIKVKAARFIERYPDYPGEIIIAADRNVPSGTVKRIMAMATLAGFGKIRLAASQKEER